MAAGILRMELDQLGLQRKIRVDSAGTHASQPGRSADPRAQKICKLQGIDLRKSRARQVSEQDFQRFDHILAMDQGNCRWLLDHCPEPYRDRISLMGGWIAGESAVEIPDPYYGNMTGFEQVFELLQKSVHGFLERNIA